MKKEETKLIITVDEEKRQIQASGSTMDLMLALNNAMRTICDTAKKMNFDGLEATREALYMSLIHTFFEESGIDVKEYMKAAEKVNKEIKDDKTDKIEKLSKKLKELFDNL